MGNCLAGDTCVFSHDPSKFMNKLSMEDSGSQSGDQSGIMVQDFNSFPSLQANADSSSSYSGSPGFGSAGFNAPLGPRSLHGPESPRLRSSRPSSRQQTRDGITVAPSIDDNEAFPSLGSASIKAGKKHHGKRGGHGHGHKENIVPSSLADIVKMSPSPAPGSSRPESRRGASSGGVAIRNGENSAAAQAIPSPKHIPWLETGDRANKAYLKARQEAIKHGGLRNKFLQR